MSADGHTHHVTIAPGNTIPGHCPEQGVEGGGLLTEEVPGCVVGAGRLGHLAIGLGLDRVDEIGELDGRLDEENRHVVSHNVEVALVCVEAYGEAVDISDSVSAASRASHSREADEERRLLALLGEERGTRDIRVIAVAREGAMSTGTAGVDSSLGNLFTSVTRSLS